MNQWKLNTPVVLILFNRPEKAAKVLEAVRQAQPPKLFVIADGARPGRPGEAESCAQTRELIETVDWDCQVFKNYSDQNLGCRKRIGETGLPWVFEQVEEAIVLEDDCLPDPSFFRFSQELLEKYRHDERVMAVCGTNLLIDWKSDLQSYHFSQFFSSWGWASWRRVWKLYDAEMKLWPNAEMQRRIQDTLCNDKQFKQYKRFFNQVHTHKTNSWAYQMLYLGLTQSCLSIIPSRNLISNIGFDLEATHTSGVSDVRASMPTFEARFPIVDPVGCVADRGFEDQRFFKLYDRGLAAKISRRFKRWLKSRKV